MLVRICLYHQFKLTILAMKDPNHYANKYNAIDKNPKKIRVLDSTLREGEQHPGVSFTNKQRIQIAWMLDYFGVDQIEISPVVSNDHKEATKTIIKQGLTADILSTPASSIALQTLSKNSGSALLPSSTVNLILSP